MSQYEIKTNSIQKVLLESRRNLWRVEISFESKCIEYTPASEEKARDQFEYVISRIQKGCSTTEIYFPEWQDVKEKTKDGKQEA